MAERGQKCSWEIRGREIRGRHTYLPEFATNPDQPRPTRDRRNLPSSVASSIIRKFVIRSDGRSNHPTAAGAHSRPALRLLSVNPMDGDQPLMQWEKILVCSNERQAAQ
jgi:hypothetical protein